MKTELKILGLVALVAIYFACTGDAGWQTLFGRKLAVVYGVGAIVALWGGGQPIGTLHPVSLRPIFIALGTLLMLSALVLTFYSRDILKNL